MPLRYLILTVLTLGSTGAAPSFTPTCEVKATFTTQKYTWGRLVTVTPTEACPLNGLAYIRFRSAYGIQPDAPPGFFPLKRGQKLTRRVPWDWWVEARTKGLTWEIAPIKQAGE